jgi:hypothetical protein
VSVLDGAWCAIGRTPEENRERQRISVVLSDKSAEKDGDLRAIDESGEDYLFSAARFVAIDVPAAVKASLLKAS